MAKSWVFFVVSSAVALAASRQVWRRWVRLHEQLREKEAALLASQQQRNQERTGRIRAQQELRKHLMGASGTQEGSTQNTFPMTPIGHVHSCYTTRNGTPRQPLLVTLARSRLVLSPGGVPAKALEGLEQFSHCWIIYVFHENTDLSNLWKPSSHRNFKAKIRVPRLNGSKLGVFATRSPHRPCPIGLTVAKVERVAGGSLFLIGADLVDGTPVLDIKPYLPYCDSVTQASVPPWVNAGDENDPLLIFSVSFTEAFDAELSRCWKKMAKHSLYGSEQELRAFIRQVLSRDIRSLNQRQNPHSGVLSEAAVPYYRANGELSTGKEPDSNNVLYHVILDGLNISYTQDNQGKILIKSAATLQ